MAWQNPTRIDKQRLGCKLKCNHKDQESAKHAAQSGLPHPKQNNLALWFTYIATGAGRATELPERNGTKMGMNIYVGNLSFNSTEGAVRSLFEQYGPVHSVKLVEDRETGRPRGFGFVEMDTEAGHAAIAALNGRELDGRSLKVNEAKPREARPPRRW